MIGDVGSFTLAHLPIVKAYARRMGFVEIIDRALPGGMHASPGKVLLGLVMNVLCSRSPLYRVEEFFRIRDVGLLLGEDMTAGMLNDDAIGRVLDRMYEYGTWKIFSEVCLYAFRNFGVDCSVVHQDTTFESRPVYGRGRPCKNGNRHVQGIRHRVLATVSENQAAVEKLREEAGCFVLLTNVPVEEKKGLEILRIYKEQDGIERNFGFLKDPLVANDVFLKKPHRIEAMGLVLVLSLLLWRLMERTMRKKSCSRVGTTGIRLDPHLS